jgi:hypothetical protein
MTSKSQPFSAPMVRIVRALPLRRLWTLFALGVFVQDVLFGAFRPAFQAPQQGEGKDDLAVVGLFVIASQGSVTDQTKLVSSEKFWAMEPLGYWLLGIGAGAGAAAGSLIRLA